jgi:adenylate cyclase
MDTGGSGGNGPSASSRPQPTSDEIRGQLDRILTSPEFPGGVGRAAVFLRYVVEEALEGRAKRIKGYSVGVEVFGRDAGNMQDDPVVRIEAGRLRRSLEHYYLTSGKDDPIKIDIPKGGYAPTFTWTFPEPDEELEFTTNPEGARPADVRRAKGPRAVIALGLATLCCVVLLASWMVTPPASPGLSATATVNAVTPHGPTLAIAPFADLGEATEAKSYAVGLTEELLTALPRFKELRVLGRETSRALPNDPDPAEARRILGAQYLLGGGVRISGDSARVTARLLDTATGTILWSQTYNDDLRARGLMTIQTEVANRVATSIAQPYGIIAQADTAAMPQRDLDAYSCTLRFYGYRAAPSVDGHQQVKDCLEKAVATYPSYATAFALLSMTYLDETRFWFNHATGDSKPALDRAMLAARRAVLIDPENIRGQQALMGALFFSRQVDDALRVGEQAMAINPNDTDLMGEYGSFLGQSGNWKHGAEVLRIALSLNPGAGGYYHGDLGLSEYMQGNYAAASDEIRQADLQKFPLFHGVAAIIFAEGGNVEDATREAAKFSEMGAAFLTNLDYELAQRIDRPEDCERIRKSLIKAGVRIPDAVAAK